MTNIHAVPPRFIILKKKFIIDVRKIVSIEKTKSYDIEITLDNESVKTIQYGSIDDRDADFDVVYGRLINLY